MPESAVPLFPELPLRLALGLLRLATTGRPSQPEAIALIHHALDHGIRLLDTADSYCLDHKEMHYGEELARQAVATWTGDKSQVRILTKVGMLRPKGKWLPCGKPSHIQSSVDKSLKALGTDRLFLLQLHVHDPMIPFEETLTALAKLKEAGKVEHIGLCNTTIAEVEQAQRHFPVAAVQNELSVLTRTSAAEGLVEWCRQKGIAFLAHRPLGGYAKVAKLATNRVLKPLAARRNTTAAIIALAALKESCPHVIPLIGATKIESINNSLAAMRLQLDQSDKTALEVKFSFQPEVPVTTEVPIAPATSNGLASQQGPGNFPEVVLLMGIQGAGKSRLVEEYVKAGYARLNRDILGGKLDDLIPKLQQLLGSGQHRVVLDNTYPTRISRSPVIHTAWRFGIPVRCRFLATSLADAQINVVQRMIEKYNRPLGPDEMKHYTKSDPNLPPPVALSRWQSSFEPPALDEGFAVVDVIPFVRNEEPANIHKAIFLDVDGTLRITKSGEVYPRHPDDIILLPNRTEKLNSFVNEGYKLFFVSNQSGIASGQVTQAAVEACFFRTAELLKQPITEVAYCPHPAFPVGCFCRKPGPGLGVFLMNKHHLDRKQTFMVGDMDSDAQFAKTMGIRYETADDFFKA